MTKWKRTFCVTKLKILDKILGNSQINYFINSILKDKDFFHSAQEELMDAKCILATIKSAMEGKFISLDPV